MQTSDLTDIRLGDRVRSRKPHPCGSDRWTVVRLGADIGIRCDRCGRRVILPRSKYVKALKAVLERGESPQAPESASTSRTD